MQKHVNKSNLTGEQNSKGTPSKNFPQPKTFLLSWSKPKSELRGPQLDQVTVAKVSAC